MKRTLVFPISSLAIFPLLVCSAFAQIITGYTAPLGPPQRTGGQILSAPNPATNKIYLTDSTNAGVVTVVDGSSRAVLATIIVGSGGSQVVTDSVTNRIYAFSGQDQTISVIDGSTDAVIATIPPVIADGCITGIAIDTAANQLVVLDPCSASGYVVDGTTYSLLSTVSVPLGTMVDYKVNPATHVLYVCDSVDHEFVAANLTTTASTTVNLGSSWPQSIAIDPGINRIYMADNVLSSLYEFDGATNALLNTIKPPTDPFSVAVNQRTHEIAVSDGFTKMYFYHVSNLVLEGQVTFANPLRILGFSVNYATNHYYTGVFPTNALAFVEGPSH